jgi:hypothetical protein
MMTDALPLLFLFLPDVFLLVPAVGLLFAAFSLAVQLLGAFSYDYRWEKLYQRKPEPGHPELWDIPSTPLLFYAERRVVILACPLLRDQRVLVHEYPLVPFGPTGSSITFAGEAAVVSGSDAILGDVHLQRGARVEGTRAHLAGRWDGVFLRLQAAARSRRLELRLTGTGRGILYVGEHTFWSEPRWTTYTVSGAFRIRHPYQYRESGGDDLTVTVGRGGGDIALESVALVGPGDPDAAIRITSGALPQPDEPERRAPLAVSVFRVPCPVRSPKSARAEASVRQET